MPDSAKNQDIHPAVSVIIPTYNDAYYLPQALDSILNQTYRDFECIVINDASTDNTGNILAGYSDPRLRTIENRTNLGLSAAPNIGYRQARGKYIARMDADDIAEASRLEKQFIFLEENPDIHLVGSYIHYIDEDGQFLNEKTFPTSPSALRDSYLNRSIHDICHPTIFFRRQTGESLGFYREELPSAEDFDFILRVIEKHDIAVIPEVLLYYRIKPYGISTVKLEQQNRCFDLVYTLYKERRDTGHDTLEKGSAEEKKALLDPVLNIPFFTARKTASERLYHRAKRRFKMPGGKKKARKWITSSILMFPAIGKEAWKLALKCYLPEFLVTFLRKNKKTTDTRIT